MNHLCKLPCQSDELFNVTWGTVSSRSRMRRWRGEEHSGDFHSGSGYGEAAQAGVLDILHNWLDCLAPHLQPPRWHFIHRPERVIEDDGKRLWIVDSVVRTLAVLVAAGCRTRLRVAWTLDAPWTWQPAARRTHNPLHNCIADVELLGNSPQTQLRSNLPPLLLWFVWWQWAWFGHNCVTLYKLCTRISGEKRGKSVVTALTRYMQRFLCIN